MPINGMNSNEFLYQPTNPREQTLQDIKGFYKSRGLDLPDRIKQEYSDIL